MSIVNIIAFNNALANSVLTEATRQVQQANNARAAAYNEYVTAQNRVVAINNQITSLQALVSSSSGAARQEAQAALIAANTQANALRTERNIKYTAFLQVREVYLGLQAQLPKASKDTIGVSLCNITSILSGGIAKTIATIAVISVGFAMFMGKASWTTALLSSAGIAITFGTQKIIQLITGGSGASNACIFSG